jgi:outer membrane receptor protein involved in Fe transport
LTFPKFLGIGIKIYHQWENAQKRIDRKLMELTSDSWNTIGVAIDYEIQPFKFILGIDNLLNHRFSRYLSTARDPYSAGIRVYDPGRTISLKIMMDKGF